VAATPNLRYGRDMDITTAKTLNNGVPMPRFGLGVFKSAPGAETADAVSAAIAAGYRSIDTATFYANEASVGEGIRAAGVPREELFLTTKVWKDDQGYDRTIEVFNESLELMGLDYLDLYLVHWPIEPTCLDTWRALETLYREKKVRAIGVSNFEARHIERVLRETEIVPAVNQIELHPYLQQKALRYYCAAHNIAVEAWSPIARGGVTEDETLQSIGAAHGKSPVQVTLRWELQREIITIPKSVHPERIRENADIFDFELSEDELARIDALDRGEAGRLGPHPDTFAR
jgi:methylglyoxal/glyoxal reductase